MNGILCIDKPTGFTSFDVVAKLRGMAKTKKIGHGGTLDPMATGVLPLFLGAATKACDLLPNQDKRYTATFRLGITTDSYDLTGTVLEQRPVCASKAQVEAALNPFVGEIQQLPPMYSAVRVNGVRLYKLARQGKETARPSRRVEIYHIRLLDAREGEGLYTIDVFCSKGTYIRSLCHDVGQALGCGAALTALRRTQAGIFSLEDCIDLPSAQALANKGLLQSRLLPIQQAFSGLPRLILDEGQARLLQNGVAIAAPSPLPAEGGQRLAAFTADERFLGLVRLEEETDRLRVVKLFEREVAR